MKKQNKGDIQTALELQALENECIIELSNKSIVYLRGDTELLTISFSDANKIKIGGDEVHRALGRLGTECLDSSPMVSHPCRHRECIYHSSNVADSPLIEIVRETRSLRGHIECPLVASPNSRKE